MTSFLSGRDTSKSFLSSWLILISRWQRNPLVCNITLMGGSACLGQGLMILATPILTRLYTPADFGVLAVYTSLLSVSVVVCLRYELALLISTLR